MSNFSTATYCFCLFALDDNDLLKDLCLSYGAFCNRQDQMPLPRLIIILPCALSGLSLLLEILNLILLCSIWERVRSIWSFFLGKKKRFHLNI